MMNMRMNFNIKVRKIRKLIIATKKGQIIKNEEKMNNWTKIKTFRKYNRFKNNQ